MSKGVSLGMGERSEPEQTETPLSVPEQGKPSPKAKTRAGRKGSAARRKTAADKNPEQFEQLWVDYRDFVVDVQSTVAGNYAKWEAIAAWDALLDAGDDVAAIVEGTAWYIKSKRDQFAGKGEAIGVAHLHRYLRDRKWEAALEHKRTVQARGPVAPAPVPTARMTRSQQMEANSRRAGEEWLAEQGVAAKGVGGSEAKFIDVEVSYA